MKQNASSPRVNEIAREAIASILLFEVSDPRLDMITVTGCEVSIDRSICHVYVSSEADRYDEVMQGLASAKPRIRSLMGKRVQWRVTPDLFFHIDKSVDTGEAMAKLLMQIPPSMQKDEE